MQYMLLIYAEERLWDAMSEHDKQTTMQAYVEFSRQAAAAGVLRGGSELAPVASARTVRVRHGRSRATDGPFAETKEHLGGYYLIDVPGIDAALEWAAKVPSAQIGSIEVRPLTSNQALSQV